MIPCANPLAQYQGNKDEVLDAVRLVLEGGNYILGPEVEKFEKSFAAFCGVDHAVGVNNGTDALSLALRAFDVGPGDEVVTVSHTALATVAAIIACGATPVLIDIDPDHYTMDPQCLRKAITSRTKAVIPVHLYGQPADMDAILKIAREHGVVVIEDCAQAAGADYREMRVGSIGDAGCFSFYPTKNLGAIGDGGMVISGNPSLTDRIGRLRQYGWDVSRATVEPGFNSRLDEMQAAILNVRLKRLDEDNRRRREIANAYREGLSELPLVLPKERPDSTHVYHLYVIACQNRDGLKERLAGGGVFAGVHYSTPAHLHAGYRNRCELPAKGLPVTEYVAGRVLSLPMYPELAISETRRVIALLKNQDIT